jgi:hypothetical protein
MLVAGPDPGQLLRLTQPAARPRAAADALTLPEAARLHIAATVHGFVVMKDAEMIPPYPEGPRTFEGSTAHSRTPGGSRHGPRRTAGAPRG